MENKIFYVTTPIYYVNDAPHIGHAYTTILADVLARYHRLHGIPTFFLTGTDEHGQKVQRAAEKGGMSPQQQADQTVGRFQALWRKLDITNDDFIRTTESRHVRVVQQILQTLFDNGEIYRAESDGGYCVPCERFYAGRELDAGTCRECGRALEPIRESNYFFRMSVYQAWLIGYIHEHPRFIQPDFRRNETLGFLQQPLNDLCISRPKSRLSWGIELPFDHDFVTYVWFDALVNYISAIGYLADDRKFQRWWPASYHLIGKDILTTHTVYWPTMLHAMNLPMPETIFAHGWWLIGDSKMSKSSGNVVNPIDMAERYGVDAFRYFLMAEMTLGQDCNFSEEAFIRRYNADLANDLGNLLNRVMKLVTSHCGGKIPAPTAANEGADEQQLRQSVLNVATRMEECLDQMRLDLGLAAVTSAVRETNRYLEKRQPWTLAKQPDLEPLNTVLYNAAETLRIVSGLLYPVMPAKMRELRHALGLPGSAGALRPGEGAAEPFLDQLKIWGKTVPGTPVGAMSPLFPRIQAGGASQAVGTARETAAQPQAVKEPQAIPPAGVTVVEYADFAKISLRTATILEAAKVEGADKLLRLQVQCGAEMRQIVAGIALYYKPEELVGKTVVVVANLKPAKIRGVESQGMLLAASGDNQLRLITLDGSLPSGAIVK
ncbi:MAG: methionine--tRNA ligase [Kiritimatiellae bacterium]|nr:methionine--tRNA ligase [Kiritimatiellia bacterium]